jgi:hypothetical protein|tara:strand:+ start:1342 stop:1671 length:330 start_codon:yes stop_codon:yes gene_type:complete
MIYNNSGTGEGSTITPHILLFRSIIVRAIMDALDVDIHAWGRHRAIIVNEANAWFNLKDKEFCEVCDNSDLDPSFIIKTYKQLVEANAKNLFKNKNLNKFLTHHLCSFH